MSSLYTAEFCLIGLVIVGSEYYFTIRSTGTTFCYSGHGLVLTSRHMEGCTWIVDQKAEPTKDPCPLPSIYEIELFPTSTNVLGFARLKPQLWFLNLRRKKIIENIIVSSSPEARLLGLVPIKLMRVSVQIESQYPRWMFIVWLHFNISCAVSKR